MGCPEPESIFNNPVTKRIGELRQDLENTPWYHFMERIYIKDELMELEDIAFNMGIEIAINDLVKMGVLKSK